MNYLFHAHNKRTWKLNKRAKRIRQVGTAGQVASVLRQSIEAHRGGKPRVEHNHRIFRQSPMPEQIQQTSRMLRTLSVRTMLLDILLRCARRHS